VRFHDVARWWPAILIALGVVRLVDSHGTASMVWGGLIAGVGALLLLDNLDLIVFDWRIVWPAILIAWGVLMLIRTTQRSHRTASPEGGPAPPEGGAAPVGGSATTLTDSGKLSLWAMFGGGERRIDAQDFRGGEVSAVFGGFEIDLRQAALAEVQATIDVNLMFGGVEIQIPDHWTVEVRGASLFGGFADETRPPRPDAPTPAPKLIVTGYAMFGGVTVTN
jgi:predicted membrane protein